MYLAERAPQAPQVAAPVSTASMQAEDELAQLEALLAAEDVSDPAPRVLRDADLFTGNGPVSVSDDGSARSALHNGDTDSSDDEDKRNCFEPRYNEYGNDIRKLIGRQEDEKRNRQVEFETRLRQANVEEKTKKKVNEACERVPSIPPLDPKYMLCAPTPAANVKADVFTDPVFGIRITKPLISSSGLLDSMQGREAINMLRVKRHTEHGDLSKDWVIAGAIVRSSGTKKSQKGSQFVIWTLSDLKDDLKTVTLFLFRRAYNDLWKTSVGTVVAVLNPSVLDKTEDRVEQASLSVDSPDRVMVLGQSKDYGICKSKKKNGEPCTSFVNLNQCEHCIYHVKQEYQKYARRQELQSSTMGKGLTQPLQNKVLGKSTVIYGGRSYSALPVAKSKKVLKQDQNRLMTLSDYYKSEGDLMMNKSPYGGPIKKSAVTVNPTGSQRIKDLERLEKLHASPFSNNSPTNSTTSLAEKVASLPKFNLAKPKIGFGLETAGTIDLSVSYGHRAIERAKANAAKVIRQNGGIKKVDPHNLRGTEAGKKRALALINKSGSDDSENDIKKPKVSKELDKIQLKGMMSERFKKILEATSAHQNLIEQHDEAEQEKYFGKLEKKEAMEEKMLNTFKVACKAVRCVKCKYTSFSASDRCKEERHPLKVFDSFKRFFKCGDCGNRTVSLELIPMHACKNCRSSRWEKAPMMKQKGVSLTEGLSIRGEEESYIGGQITSGKNINLLVPDSD